jgi:hypothetical protein
MSRAKCRKKPFASDMHMPLENTRGCRVATLKEKNTHPVRLMYMVRDSKQSICTQTLEMFV